MKKLDIILWLIVLILSVFIVKGRQKLVVLHDKQEALMKRNGEQNDEHQESTGKFRASMRARSEDKRVAAEKLILDWRDHVNQSENGSYDKESVARRLIAEIDIFERLRHIDPDQWTYIIDRLEALGVMNESRAYRFMMEVNPRKFLDLILSSSKINEHTKRSFIRSALQACANEDPVGMIDWISAHSNDYSKWIGEEGKLELLKGVAIVDAWLALQTISKLGIVDTQSAVDEIFNYWKVSGTQKDKLEKIRSFRENTDFKDLDFSIAYMKLVFKENYEFRDYHEIVAFIESTSFSQDEMTMIMRNTPNEVIRGHEVEWIDWTNNLDLSEVARDARHIIIRNQIGYWTYHSFEEASNWMNMSGDINLRKDCLPRFLDIIEYRDMDINAYIESMPEGELRDYAEQYASEMK